MSLLLGDLTFSVELIAVGVGAALVIWGMRNEGRGVVLARCAGYFVGILAAASLVATVYLNTKIYFIHKNAKRPAIHRTN